MKSSLLRPFGRLVFTGLCLFGLAGCGDGLPKTYKATGKVVYKDLPVEGAVVTFELATGSVATGVTNAEGQFELTTFSQGDGAVAGTHIVTVRKTKGGLVVPKVQTTVDVKSMEEANKKQTVEMQEKMKKGGGQKLASAISPPTTDVLPVKYSKKETSPLKSTVTHDANANDFSIKLED